MNNKNTGFSLIELLIVIAVMAVLSGLIFVGPGMLRRKETDKYTRELCSQIREMQTLSMAKAGQWRLAFYGSGDKYYCVQERREPDGSGGFYWSAQSGQRELGLTAAMEYKRIKEDGSAPAPDSVGAGANENGGTPDFWWCFNRDTGACTAGAGTYTISGAGKTNTIKVYRQSGRCEETGK